MRPTLHLGLRLGPGAATPAALRSALLQPVQGFDAARSIAQILAVQALHYLVLALLLPMTLSMFSRYPSALSYQGGGPLSVHYLLDWREMAGVQTWSPRTFWNREYLHPAEDQASTGSWRSVWLSDGRVLWEDQVSRSTSGFKGDGEAASFGQTYGRRPSAELANENMWEARGKDDARGWAIALAWILTGFVDVHILATLIRRPTYILDHTMTLHFLHLVLTTVYSRSLPWSVFYWLVMVMHAGGCVVWAEALAIRKEMGLGVTTNFGGRSSADGGGGGRSGGAASTSRRAANTAAGPGLDEEETTTLFSATEGMHEEKLTNGGSGYDAKGSAAGEKIEMRPLGSSAGA